MTKELLQQALDEAKADAIYVFTYAEGISAASKDAIEYMHSWLTVYFEKQALAQQEQPAQGKCKCGHVGTSITVVESFPVHSVSVDEEDPDYKEHYHGLDVDATLQIGLEICRNCKTINGFWIEDTGGAEFYADWGKPRYTHPAPTQPALSDDDFYRIIRPFYGTDEACKMALPLSIDGFRAIEAHCRGGNHG